MHRLFVAGQPIKSGTVTQTLTDFEETKAEIHREIKAFVAELGVLGAITGKDKVIGKIEELIVQNTNGTTDSNH